MKFFNLPTWLLCKFFLLFLPKHPWKGRKINLAQWAHGGSPIRNLLDFMFWVSTLNMTLLYLLIY